MPRQSNDLNDERLFDSAQFRLDNFLITHCASEKKSSRRGGTHVVASRKSNTGAVARMLRRSLTGRPWDRSSVGLDRESQVV